jgi:PAS domain-containing protein
LALDLGAVIGKTCYETLTHCEHNCPFCLANKLWETNESQKTEAEYLGRYWEGRWVPFTDDLYIHYIIDITERKQMEDELRESETLLIKIAENFPNSFISIIEKDFTVGFTSGKEFSNQNLDPKQFIGLTIEQVFADEAALVREYYKKNI